MRDTLIVLAMTACTVIMLLCLVMGVIYRKALAHAEQEDRQQYLGRSCQPERRTELVLVLVAAFAGAVDSA